VRRGAGRAALLALGLAALAACAQAPREEAPRLAPVTQHSPEALPPPSSGGAVTVAAGDTLYELARRYGVPVRELIEINRLAAPYALQVGQRLELPTARFHTVARGDTLYSISRMYRADMAELARMNDIKAPYAVRLGQSLRLPGGEAGVQVAASGGAAPLPQRKPGASPAPAAAPAVVPVVAQAAVPPAPASPARHQAAPVQGVPVQAATTQVAAAAPKPAPAPAATPASAAAAPPVADPPGRAGSGFAWPVRGRILSDFGPKPGGLHNDGINIGAPSGTPVSAVENGVVAYAGDELKGFGNLLLIRHADGWVSAYAHLDEMAVRRGDKVRRGQRIGTVGSTGAVTAPQLHFELRRGSRAVDPREHMVSGAVNRADALGGRQGPG
jgi:murein DD-endopeptidase MepM/ murein hydrolase activator NlpD